MSTVSRVADTGMGGSSGGFARTGAFSPEGFALLGAPVFAVWMAAIGVALLRRRPEFVPARSNA